MFLMQQDKYMLKILNIVKRFCDSSKEIANKIDSLKPTK